MKKRNRFGTQFYRDGLITYWSVYRQTWVRCVRHVPDRELAAMHPQERKMVMKHIERGEP
jgi:hypothetical protein